MVTEVNKLLVIRHVSGSGLGHLETVLKREQIVVEYLDIATGATLSKPIVDYSHLVILGGPISAYEDEQYPFLRYEFKLLETALEHQIPTLGICLGSQVLAKVLGANVYRGEVGREAGWCNIQLTDKGSTDPLFQGFPQQFKVFESHQDTFEIPKDCVHLATTDKYSNQAFRYQDYVWALQFHLEINEQVLRDCSTVIAKELEESRIHDTNLAQLLTEARYYAPLIEPLADGFMQRFMQTKAREVV